MMHAIRDNLKIDLRESARVVFSRSCPSIIWPGIIRAPFPPRKTSIAFPFTCATASRI